MSKTPQKSPRCREKFITLDRFLRDDHAMVHIVPTRSGVQIPEHLAEQTTVTLKVSRQFRGRLVMTEAAGIEAELLFSNEYFTCKIPFDAVWAATSASGQMRMWPEDTPDEILESLAVPVGQTSAERIARSADTAVVQEKTVRQETDEMTAMPTDSGSAAQEVKKSSVTKTGRPALRRIK